MFIFARVIWWLSVVVGLIPFLDMARLTLPGARARFITQRHTARVVLGIAELAVLVIYFVALRGRWPIVDSRPLLAIFGAIVALEGALLAAWAKIVLGRYFSATFGVKEGHQLITTGPYAFVRHPIYLGILVFCIGSALVWNDAALFAVTAALCVLFYLHIRVEEKLFLEHFGEEYIRYRKDVAALIPMPKGKLNLRG